MKVKVVLAVGVVDALAFIPLEALGVGVDEARLAPHVQENCDG